MKKVYDFLAKRQYLSFPMIIFVIFFALFELQKLSAKTFEGKVNGIVSLAGVFIGVLLTVFTLYTSIPKNNQIMQRVIKFGHHQIFRKSILYGCMFFMICVFLWLFGASEKWILIFLLMGMSDVIISIKYIYLINEYV
ncbi:MAG: hypothetical protein MR278_06995 [Bacteroidales bacterium]|nr:hypothetical protein [Anaerotignum sp.]MCI5679704.1 hypothetical protein [Bacteroidales bacterium]MDY3925711.1 hypothetical protein [Anaerotignum sp.]